MGAENHLKEARELLDQAVEELRRAKERGDGKLLRDSCAKGWLSTLEVTYALFAKEGVAEEEIPKTDRGRRFMIYKYAPEELRWLFFSLRDNLHIEGYYDGSLDFDEVQRHLSDLKLYI